MFNGIRNPHSLDGRFHIMHTDNMSTMQNSRSYGSHGSMATIRRVRILEQAANERFSRSANEKRQIWKCFSEAIESGNEFPVLIRSFSKAYSWIDDDRFAFDSTAFGHSDAAAQPSGDLLECVSHWWQPLHRSRRTARMH